MAKIGYIFRQVKLRFPQASGPLMLVSVSLGVIIVADAIVHHHAIRTTAYTLAIATAWLLIQALTPELKAEYRPTVRSPGLETAVAALSFVLGLGFLVARLIAHYQAPPGIARLLFFAIGFGSGMNVTLALFLLARGYGSRDFGIHFTGLVPAAAIISVFATIGLLSHSNFTLADLYRENGSILGIIGTALMAAVPEEFFRWVWQTRLAALLRGNDQIGLMVACSLWAILHAPVDWSQTHNFANTAISVINIIPLGMLWGYLMLRSKSILPAVLVHATNIWGLQNL